MKRTRAVAAAEEAAWAESRRLAALAALRVARAAEAERRAAKAMAARVDQVLRECGISEETLQEVAVISRRWGVRELARLLEPGEMVVLGGEE